MTALTPAVFDAMTGDRAGPDMTTDAAFAKCASLNREHKGGYVVGPAGGLPGHRVGSSAPYLAVASPPKPEAPVAAVAKDPEGPGLFD